MEYPKLTWVTFSLIISAFCFAISTAECPADKDKDWSYDKGLENGPPHWSKKYPSCGGKSQSPINIVTADTTRSGTRQVLKLEGYDEPIGKVSILNNGHMIMVEPKDGKERSVTVDDKTYTLQHFHFHWGDKSSDGSEDEINGNKYTMEIHLVHKDSDGKLAVIAGFLSEGNSKNPALDKILFAKQAYEYEGGHFEGELPDGKIDLDDLIKNRCSYYKYSGSMGFPPCKEDVTWLVCKTDQEVKKSQMEELFSLYSVKKGTADADKCHLVNIYRPVQPLNGRKVYS